MPVLKQRGCALDAQTRIQTAFAEGKMSKMKNLEKEWPHMAVLGASFLLLPALAVLTGEGAQ